MRIDQVIFRIDGTRKKSSFDVHDMRLMGKTLFSNMGQGFKKMYPAGQIHCSCSCLCREDFTERKPDGFAYMLSVVTFTLEFQNEQWHERPCGL